MLITTPEMAEPICKTLFMRINNSLLVMLSLFFFSGCIEQIDLEIPKGFEDTIVIQGKLIKGTPSVFSMTVSRLFDFTIEGRSRISVQNVTLFDEEGKQVEIKARGTGLYYKEFQENDPDFSVEFGKSYKIQVTALDGRSFESSFEPLWAVPPIKNVRVNKVLEQIIFNGEEIEMDTLIRFTLDSDLQAVGNPEKSYLRWDVERNFRLTDSEDKVCYVQENAGVTDLPLFNGPNQTANLIENINIFDEGIDFQYAEGSYITIIQESLSETAFEYWAAIKELNERGRSVFAEPAGKLRSNFQDLTGRGLEAFGYFYATNQDTVRTYISPEFAGNPKTFCPPPPDITRLICNDCLLAGDATTEKPYFWVD